MEETELKQLAEEFDGRGEVRGFHFKQIQKNDSAYLYEVTLPEHTKVTHYEIFKKVIHIRFMQIAYPKSGSFGISAFTRKTYQEAIDKFNDLTNKAANNVAKN